MGYIITDPIGDMLARIKNSNQRKHKKLSIPHSQIKTRVLDVLKNEGFIVDYEVQNEIPNKEIIVTLKYSGDQRVITNVKRISKPGLRVYSTFEEIPKTLPGFGIAIISTSKGIVSDREARELKIGGEILAYVW